MNLLNLLRHISLVHIKFQKARTAIAICGISLGVASLVSIDIVNKSVLHSFEDSINRLTGRAVLQITSADSGFPEEMLDRVQNIPGVEHAVPVIETNVKFAGGTGRSLLLLGIDALQDHNIRSYSVMEESADIPDPLLFLAKPDSILLTREMAEREEIKIDQKVRVQTVQGIKTFIVRGLLNPEGPAKAAGGDIAVMDIFAAQMAFGKEGRIDRIDISILPGETLDSIKNRIREALPEGYVVDTPSGRNRQVELTLARFRNSIGLVGFMALFVGMYLIYNAVSISVVQRQKEIGILRALGATRGQIMRLFLSETTIISIIGSLLGVGVGILFAKLTVGIVARSVTDIYMKASVTDLTFSCSRFITNVCMGIAASLLAAAFPAAASTRITAISAMRSLPYSPEKFQSSRKIRIAAAACLVASMAVFAFHKVADASSWLRSSTAVFSLMAFLMVSVSLATPFFLKRFLKTFHNSLSRLGTGGKLAGLSLEKNLSRNSVAAAAFFFSISLFVSSANLIYSTQKTLHDHLDSVMNCDILVSSGHPMVTGGSSNIPMPAEMGNEIKQIPAVLSADPFHKTYVNYQGRRMLLEMTDVLPWMEYSPFVVAEGDREDVRRLVSHENNIAVNEYVATQYRIKRGDSILLPTPHGTVRFAVTAVIVNYASDSGVFWMDIHTYQRHWHDHLVDMFQVRVKSKDDFTSVRETIIKRFGKKRELFVQPAREFKEQVLKMVDRMFIVNNAVNIITLLIAGFGIVVTHLASVFERTREIGVLRAIGMMKRQVSAVIVIESALLGAAGGLLGIATGSVIGFLNFEVFFRQGYGESFNYSIHYESMFWAILLSVGLAALAGLYPARHAAKTNIVKSLTYE